MTWLSCRGSVAASPGGSSPLFLPSTSMVVDRARASGSINSHSYATFPPLTSVITDVAPLRSHRRGASVITDVAPDVKRHGRFKPEPPPQPLEPEINDPLSPRPMACSGLSARFWSTCGPTGGCATGLHRPHASASAAVDPPSPIDRIIRWISWFSQRFPCQCQRRRAAVDSSAGRGASIPARCGMTNIPARCGMTNIPARCRMTSILARCGMTSIPARWCVRCGYRYCMPMTRGRARCPRLRYIVRPVLPDPTRRVDCHGCARERVRDLWAGL
jgi:hypothetical protein